LLYNVCRNKGKTIIAMKNRAYVVEQSLQYLVKASAVRILREIRMSVFLHICVSLVAHKLELVHINTT